MPEFSTFFNTGIPNKKLSDKEILQALRYSIASESESIQIYEQIMEAVDNKLVKKVMQDVADEEKEHIGEFRKLIEELYPDELDHYDEGAQEVEEMMEED